MLERRAAQLAPNSLRSSKCVAMLSGAIVCFTTISAEGVGESSIGDRGYVTWKRDQR